MEKPLEPRKSVAGPQEIEGPVGPVFTPQLSVGYDLESDAEGGGFSRLHEYWRSIRRHLWLVVGITVLITTLVAIYMARQPDIYEAQARVQVDLEDTNPAVSTLKSDSVIFKTQDPHYFNTQLEILSGMGLLGRVVKTLDLENDQAFLYPQSKRTPSTWHNLRRIVGLGGKDRDQQKNRAADSVRLTQSIAPAPAREDLVEINRLAPYVGAIQTGLTVKQLNETRLIDIRFKHPDPQISSKIVNTIADAFVQSNLERKTETSTTAADFLRRRIAELQVEIRTGEERLINYAKNHQILSLDASQNTVVDRLAVLNRQLLEAENERKLAEASYHAILAPGAAEALAGDTAQQTTQAMTRLVELRQQRAQLLVDYTEKYPQVTQIDQQIAVLEKQLKETRDRATSMVTTNLETRYRQALAREEALRKAFNQQRGETLMQNEAAVNYRIIQQEIETNKKLMDGLLQRSKETGIVLVWTPNNIHVLDYAPVPKEPVGPRRLQGVALGFLLSLVFGAGLSRYLEYLDDTLHSADDVERVLRLPVIAVTPSVGSLARRRLLPTMSALQKRNGNSNPELLINQGVHSPLTEAYRQLRTSVLYSSAGGAPQTLLITSSQPAEGKTTTTINTAVTLAQTGANVLVIDADLRRPRIHSILGLENRHGLSTILGAKMSEDGILATIQHHGESGLYVLTAGPVPSNPTELLGSEQMRLLMVIMKSTFTHIIVDSPAIASLTDGVLLSSIVDGVLLVVHGGRASQGIVRHSRQLLQNVGAKINGVVLNNVNLRPHDSYYKYYYRSYYEAEADADKPAPEAADSHSKQRTDLLP